MKTLDKVYRQQACSKIDRECDKIFKALEALKDFIAQSDFYDEKNKEFEKNRLENLFEKIEEFQMENIVELDDEDED